MKRIVHLLMMAGFLATVFGCSLQRMPEGKLKSLEYRVSASMAGSQFEAYVTSEENGAVVLRGMREQYGPLFERTLSANEVDGFVQIIREEKMYQYKEHYKPFFKVLDGYMWHFSAHFEQGEIYSTGSNARPKGDGLERIEKYVAKLLENAQPSAENPSEE